MHGACTEGDRRVRRSLLLWIVVCLLANPAAPPIASAQDAQSVAAAGSASVCVIVVQAGDGHAYAGSGFLVGDGLVLTAHHVVANAGRIVVKFPGAAAVDARVVSDDGPNDLAILGVPPSSIRPLALGNSDLVQAGQTVIAIGYPRVSSLGVGAPTVTEGIISAIRPGALQMQVPVSPGNSGGPLLTLRGEVVGVVRSYLGGVQQGINFATPINAAKPLLITAAGTPSYVTHVAPSQPAPDPAMAQGSVQAPLTQTVTDPQGRFTMNFPGDWEVATQPGSTIALLAAGPVFGASSPGRPVLVVASGPLKRPLSVQEFGGETDRLSRTMLPHYTVIQESNTTVQGRPAYYRYLTSESSNGLALYHLQVFFTVGLTAYIVMASTLNDRDRILRDMAIATRIIQTFRVTQPTN
jgi:hypothetical protein